MDRLIPKITYVECDITHRCSLKCRNCDRMVGVCPTSNFDMEIGYFAEMLKKSLEINFRWEKIMLMGGEPTEHPNWRDFVVESLRYKEEAANDDLIVQVKTNGWSKNTRRELEWLSENYPSVSILNSQKVNAKQSHFAYMNVAPCDSDKSMKNCVGCDIVWKCGIGFNKNGFYPCGCAGAIDRCLGKNRALKLEDLSVERLQDMYDLFCPLCGHYSQGIENNSDSDTNQRTSETWQKIVQSYHNNLKLL